MANTLHTTLVGKSKLDQIDGLQVLRFLAVTLVAWLHTAEKISDSGGARLSRSSLLGIDGVFGIDIFFVLSGFIMTALVLRDRRSSGSRTSWAFLSRRLVRIFPIYWLFALVVVVMKLHSSGSVSVTYLPSFFLVPPISLHWSVLIGVSWTLDFEMFFYCCIAIFLLFTTRHTAGWLLIGLCILVAIGMLFPPAIGSVQMVYLNPILLEFAMGILIALIHFKLGPSPRMGLALLALGLIMTVD